MENRRDRTMIESTTLPSSPTHSSSSSSSNFEFSVPVSPRKSCPADELFYRGQLLPLYLPPRISMVRSLLLSSSSSVAARHSTDSDLIATKSNYFSLSRFSNSLKKDPKSGSAKLEVIRKYLRKVNPFYEKLSKKQQSCKTASCPSSMRSSPTRSGSIKVKKSGFTGRVGVGTTSCGSYCTDTSTMVELQSAIQGAIAHCKNSME